jgi:hypothetical protein
MHVIRTNSNYLKLLIHVLLCNYFIKKNAICTIPIRLTCIAFYFRHIYGLITFVWPLHFPIVRYNVSLLFY